MQLQVAFVLALLAVGAYADCYMHNPRGSNNRLNERGANRDNGNRLFDSQNNNRGGYNVGEKTATTVDSTQPPYGYYPPTNTFNAGDYSTPMQYQMMFYEGSTLQLEWTAQHGCGGDDTSNPNILHCQFVWQYACDYDGFVSTPAGQPNDPAMVASLRDGGDTNTPDEPNTYTDVPANNVGRGHHESEASYYECKTRQRQRGLFHADQRPGGDTAIFTRQNNNGNRDGLECTEERDYYPYWIPSIWRDIAYLTNEDIANTPRKGYPNIKTYIQTESQNTNLKYKCIGKSSQQGVPTDDQIYASLDQTACASKGGVWAGFTWGITPPDVQKVQWLRANHLGNADAEGQATSYNWTLPTFAKDLSSSHLIKYNSMVKCVVRIRYNISTDDYDAWTINSTMDDDPQNGVVSPIQQNPTINVGVDLQGLRLAINTAQFGRTFQDRSHVFYIAPRPASFQTQKIWNLNVRGKRCNIVQCYPSVEYDFIPNKLAISTADVLHIQWTGSNTHNNGDPGGDGQTGDAGQGTEGTDRHNFVQYFHTDDNYPIPLDKFQSWSGLLWTNSKCYNSAGNPLASGTWQDCAVVLASSGYYQSVAAANLATANNFLDPLLDNAPPSLVGGVLMQINTAGTYNYANTRNNNFTNRSQKGTLVVS